MNLPVKTCHENARGIQPQESDPSGLSVKSDDHLAFFNNYRNFSFAIRVFQHGVKTLGVGHNINIFNFTAFFCICFTSSSCKRSGILAIDKDFFSHNTILRCELKMRVDEKLCYQPKSDYADKVNVQDSR